MKYYIIQNDDHYYSHSRPFISDFDPQFTRNMSNAKYFTDRAQAKEILKMLKESGYKDYKIVELKGA